MAFEIYIGWIVDNIYLNKRLKIKELNKITKLISFNYTDTYRKIYNSRLNDEDICFIHGQAGSNNLVLGIDEYLSNEEKDTKLDFVRFKKYFQRIYKKTNWIYKKWLSEISKESTANVYIIGHSLDETDKDILEEIITHPRVVTTIYYHDDKSYDTEIINMIKLIGQNKLRQMIYGINPKIIFKNQYDIIKNKIRRQEQ